MLFRVTNNESKQLISSKAALVFELVLLVQRGVDAPTEMSCGWCELPVDELKMSMTHKLQIKGGTPMALTSIKQGDDHVDRSGLRFIQKMFVGVEKHLEVEVTPFEKLDESTKFHMNLMPSTCLLYTTLMHFMSGFMNYKADKLLSQSSSTGGQFFKPGGDVIISNFPKIIDCPDICEPLARIWLEDVMPRLQGANSDNIEYCI